MPATYISTRRYVYVAGFLKCATTAIYTALASHPEVRTLSVKETHWWTRTRRPFTHSEPGSLEDVFQPATDLLKRARNPSRV
jgi:hypothetical protein